eukprot:TRINITY_DN77328_c0_g1_i1.p1 TRINITY_DN77328_c0_g1~~TRINITY_DN77328_c0_g1_i1.p1  ORF type:complete len:624 (-),score=83.14 TRINITY_DN77328_c0_g1_i1:245-2083(-)
MFACACLALLAGFAAGRQEACADDASYLQLSRAGGNYTQSRSNLNKLLEVDSDEANQIIEEANSGEAIEDADIIIIGSGTVGTGLSALLSKLLPHKMVVVLEAGGAGQHPLGHTPLQVWNGSAFMQPLPSDKDNGFTEFDVPGNYGVYSTSGTTLNSYIPGNGHFIWPAEFSANHYCAKVRGGGSSINGALNQEVWPDMYPGCPDFGWPAWPESWNATVMEPYFDKVKVEFTITATPSADGRHYLDDSGPKALASILATPCRKDSPKPCPYPNGFFEESQERPRSGSMGIPRVSAFGGLRQSFATSMQQRMRSHANYSLRLESEVIKIGHQKNRASFVTYQTTSGTSTISLRKNGIVVASAGAIGTPRVLLNSSIGDPNILGHGLSDHSLTRQFFSKPDMIGTAFDFQNKTQLNLSWEYFLQNQTGPFAQYGPVWVAFIRDPTTPGMPEDYDVEVFINPQSKRDLMEVWYALMRPTCSNATLVWDQTKNRLVNVQDNLYLACDRDKQTMSYARKVMQARMEEAGVSCAAVQGESCGDVDSTTPVYGLNHFVGTCALGPCVDPDTLLLHGWENVAVADASIVPRQIWGHPVMTLQALTFRAADMLAGHFRKEG